LKNIQISLQLTLDRLISPLTAEDELTRFENVSACSSCSCSHMQNRRESPPSLWTWSFRL